MEESSEFLSFQVILHKLEESMSEQTEVDQKVPADRDLDLLDSLDVEQTVNRDQIRPVEVEAIREFLSAKNLKSVRNDSSRRSSSCFGRRMDRIGSMSSLGCNTVGKSSKSVSSAVNTGTSLEVLIRVPSGTYGRNFPQNCDLGPCRSSRGSVTFVHLH